MKASKIAYKSPTLVLLTFDWPSGSTRDDFLGFAIERTPGPGRTASSWLPNRTAFGGPVAAPDPDSCHAPIRKSPWWDSRIEDTNRGTELSYRVVPMHCRSLRPLSSTLSSILVIWCLVASCGNTQDGSGLRSVPNPQPSSGSPNCVTAGGLCPINGSNLEPMGCCTGICEYHTEVGTTVARCACIETLSGTQCVSDNQCCGGYCDTQTSHLCTTPPAGTPPAPPIDPNPVPNDAIQVEGTLRWIDLTGVGAFALVLDPTDKTFPHQAVQTFAKELETHEETFNGKRFTLAYLRVGGDWSLFRYRYSDGSTDQAHFGQLTDEDWPSLYADGRFYMLSGPRYDASKAREMRGTRVLIFGQITASADATAASGDTAYSIGVESIEPAPRSY